MRFLGSRICATTSGAGHNARASTIYNRSSAVALSPIEVAEKRDGLLN